MSCSRPRPRGRLVAIQTGMVLLAMIVAASRSGAEEVESKPDSALAASLEQIAGTPLALEDAWEQARSKAASLLEAEAAVDAARAAVKRERGAFDPEIYGEATRSSDDRPTASPFSGASVLKTKLTSAIAGVRVRLPIGTDLEASLTATERETNSAFASLDPEYDTFGNLSLRQPLLAGFGPATRKSLSSAERNLESSRARYEDEVLALRARLEGAYWDLYAAERDYAVQQLIRDRARAFLTEAQIRARAGLVGPNQVANARVFLAEQEQAVLDREERLDQDSDALATLIGARPAGGMTRFRPTDEPPRSFPIEAADSLVARGIRRNHELRAARADVEVLRELARGARWDMLPAVDLVGSLGGNGLSGTGRDVIFGSDTLHTAISGGFGDTWRQVRNRDFPTWSAGVRVVIPIGFRAGAGEHERLMAEAAGAEQRLVAASRALEERIRSSNRELLHGMQRLAAAQDGVEASQEQVRIGLVEYRNGRTTAFELVRLGADLAAAQQRFSQALVRAAKAAAELSHLTSGAYPGPANARP